MDTYDRLVRILADEHKLAADALQPDARLDELGIDSLSVMELLFKIEEEFNIQVPNDQVPLLTIRDMVSYVDNLVAQQTNEQSGAQANAQAGAQVGPASQQAGS